MEILKKIFSAIPAGHQAAIKQVMLAIRKSSEDKTSRELQFDAKRLVNMVKGNKSVYNPIYANTLTVISSDVHNQNMEGAYIDLKTLYTESAHIGNIQSYQKASIESNFSKARAAILKLINDARIFTLRTRYQEFDDIKLVNFNIARNETKLTPTAIIDQESRLLKLPEVAKVRNHIKRRGQRNTKASVELLSAGQKGLLSTQFSPDLALDSKTETFWGEIIYSSEPLQTTYTRINISGHGYQNEFVTGPVVKFKIEFSSAESINQIKILPFAPTAVKVLDITYKPSSASTVKYPIPDFTVEESLDWIEYNFDRIYAKEIEIVFAQESYREYIIHAPKHVLYSTDFFLRLLEERKLQLQEIPDLDSIDIGGNHEIYNQAIEDLSSLILEKELDKSPSTELDLAGKVIMSIGEALASFSPDVATLLEDVSNYTAALPKEISDKIETITKYEYILGAKEIQVNYVVYSPYGIYQSPEFDTAATVVSAQLLVEESHPSSVSINGSRPNTSTEWEVEFSSDRKVPIYPANNVENGFLPVIGERLILDPITKLGLSRFSAHMSTVAVRENGRLLDPYWGYSSVWSSDYDGRLQITITETEYDSNAVYTIDYYAAPSSKEIDVLSRYDAKKIPSPDSYDKTDSDKKVVTSYFPFVDYNIINSDVFLKDTDTNDYKYIAPTGVYNLGLLRVNPNWVFASGIVPDSVISGSNQVVLQTGWVTTGDFSVLDSAYLTNPYRYYLKIQNYETPFEVQSIDSSTGLSLTRVPLISSGEIGDTIDSQYFIGNALSGTTWPDVTSGLTGYLEVPYELHVVYKNGDELFGFDHLTYAPITVYIGGSRAKNISDYENLEQPAFTVSESNDDEYEFIHDGKNIYFNQGISSTEILVDYKKIIDYIRVNCILRSNKIINPNVSPQVNEYTLMLNTTVL